MRTSLVPGMLDMLGWNLNRDVLDARLFEIGGLFEMLDGSEQSLGARVSARRWMLCAALRQ